MIYTLNELLTKMGAPETKEKGRLGWHYFDKVEQEVAGFAEIRLINGGQALVAELQRQRHNYEDDAGTVHPTYSESFYLHAEKTGGGYKVTKIAFDGEEYSAPQKPIVELGLSIFHARALEISILMVEQTFNKQDILTPVVDEQPQFRGVPVHVKNVLKKETWGTVIPFRPRSSGAGSGALARRR